MTDNKIALYRAEIKKDILGNKEVFNTLAQNTFKGLTNENIPQAILQGMLKGFKLEDFLVGNVYALPFNNKRTGKQEFSLVNSIDHARKVAQKAGQSGKSAPSFEDKNDDSIFPVTCSVTVWKEGGDERGYTALVYFSEYNTGKNLWVTKPRTMIAKVAEMHALRMAFPEALQNFYVEEEFEKEHTILDADLAVPEEIEKERKSAIETISKEEKADELQTFFMSLSADLRKDDQVIEAYNAQKEKIKQGIDKPVDVKKPKAK